MGIGSSLCKGRIWAENRVKYQQVSHHDEERKE
jgi:hypothetical protein